MTNRYEVMNRLTNRASINGHEVSFAYNPASGLRTQYDYNIEKRHD